MTSLSFIYPASPTPPLTCDCAGAPVYLRFKAEYANRTREGTGSAHAILESRAQSADGTWTYQFTVHEPDLVTPLPALSSGMIQSICCQGCQGYAAEAFDTDEFGGVILAADADVTVEDIHIRRFIRPYRLTDIRIWTRRVALAPVTFQVLIQNEIVLASPLTISPGQSITGNPPSFIDGKALIIPENAVMTLRVLTTGSMPTGYGDSDPAQGLELWGYGHLNPGPYLLQTAGESGAGAPPAYATGPIDELVKIDGATFKKTTWPDGSVFYQPGFTTPPA